MHLRNKQRREWEKMKKQIDSNNSKQALEEEQLKLQEEAKRKEDKIEMEETLVSKKLSAVMSRNARQQKHDTLQNAVDLLANQNGNFGYEKNVCLYIYIPLAFYMPQVTQLR